MIDITEIYIIAINSSTPPEVIVKLAEHENQTVRNHVACNLSAPPEVLAKLAKESSWLIRENVGANRSTPVKALSQLAKDKVHYVRAAVAKNCVTAGEVLFKLTSDSHPEVSVNAVGNPNLYVYLHELAVKEGYCSPDYETPSEWLKAAYL